MLSSAIVMPPYINHFAKFGKVFNVMSADHCTVLNSIAILCSVSGRIEWILKIVWIYPNLVVSCFISFHFIFCSVAFLWCFSHFYLICIVLHRKGRVGNNFKLNRSQFEQFECLCFDAYKFQAKMCKTIHNYMYAYKNRYILVHHFINFSLHLYLTLVLFYLIDSTVHIQLYTYIYIQIIGIKFN